MRSHFRRAKRTALGLSLVAASWILFLLYEYSRQTYQRTPFWAVRWGVFGVIFGVIFLVLWLRARRRTGKDVSAKENT